MIVKYRVHEVAKDFGVPSKEIIEIIKKYTGEEKKHMTSLTDTELNIIFEYFTQKINMINSEQDYLNIKKPELKKSNNNKIKNNKNIKESQEKIILSGSSIKKDQENIVSLITEDEITQDNKIINTRFVNVNTENIDKYNEKYDRIALDKLTSEHNIHKQKITPCFY